jgi:hypothetical protein
MSSGSGSSGSGSSSSGYGNEGMNFLNPQKQGPAGKSGSYYVNMSDGQQLHIHPHSDGNGQTFSLYENGKPISRITERKEGT